MIDAGELLLIGAVAGVMGGLLGIGGGLVMIPAMLLALGERFGANSFHLYKLASITTSFLLAIPAGIRHARQHAMHATIVLAAVPCSVLGAAAGVGLAMAFTGEQTHILSRVFGAFMIITALFNASQALANRRAAAAQHDDADSSRKRPRGPMSCPVPQRRRALIAFLVGLPSGLIAGLLGVAGGVWAVPAQNLVLGVNLRNAIANSTGIIIFTALATAVAKGISVSRMQGVSPLDAWALTLLLAPGALVGGWIGAGLTHRLPVRWLRWAVDGLLVATGIRLFL